MAIHALVVLLHLLWHQHVCTHLQDLGLSESHPVPSVKLIAALMWEQSQPCNSMIEFIQLSSFVRDL